MKNRIILLIGILVLFSGCSRRSEHKVDISTINIKVEVARFDRDLFALDKNNMTKGILLLEKKYGNFFKLFNTQVIQIGPSTDPAYPRYLKEFLTADVVGMAYQTSQKVFPNMDGLNKELTDAFKRYKYYFPNKPVPKIYTYIAGFNQSIVVDDHILGIGLDKYLGSDCKLYLRLGLPRYMTHNMAKEKIASDCMHAMALTDYTLKDSTVNLLANMIYYGKALYFTKAMLPDEEDTIITGFTKKQLQWCKQNEKDMWTYLVERKLLFSSEVLTISKFMDIGPFTKEFTKDSPAQAAVWLGWRIIESYMKNNPDVTLPELMEENNAQEILTLSNYQP
ncbi:MAG: DUF2268 domain-containing putative Zn-dependent protease [Bacteroidota bacterium]|nr:DUF2268 domain-containing putative Zn-dependent protease [Bacteroidota bacterium]MDP4227698.1 DUF2268 domain-containing putative Zn-dependent protease [Bacteroidota bacterium]MDP4274856.1 DUF2268 domain-containing putative Zn-dependent protease [Bacteroidota bacterium]